MQLSSTTTHESFHIDVHPPLAESWLSRADPYAAAMAFVQGQIDVSGDMVEAVRSFLARASIGWRGAGRTQTLSRHDPAMTTG